VATRLINKAKELGYDVSTIEDDAFTKEGLELKKSSLTTEFNEAKKEIPDVKSPKLVTKTLIKKSLQKQLDKLSSFPSADAVDIEANITKALTIESNLEALEMQEVNAKGEAAVTYSELRRAHTQELKNLRDTISRVSKITEQNGNRVRRSATRLVSKLSVPSAYKVKLLKSLYKVNAMEDIDGVMASIGQVLEAVAVDNYRQAIDYNLNEAMTSTSVNPQVQRLGNHLAAVFNGKVPPNKYGDSKNPSDVLAHEYELMAERAKTTDNLIEISSISDAFQSFTLEEADKVLVQRKAQAEYDTLNKQQIVDSVLKIGLTSGEISQGLNRLLKPNIAATSEVKENKTNKYPKFWLPAEHFTALNALAELMDSGALGTEFGSGPAYKLLDVDRPYTRQYASTFGSTRCTTCHF
jgi:hypothetical protein